MKLLWIALIAGVLLISGCTTPPAKDYSAFSTCLTEAGITKYGAFSCSACSRIKLTLGEAWYDLNYVECDPRCARDANGQIPGFCDGFESQSQQCLDIGITHTPSWVQNNEIIYVGGDLNQLSQISGCPLPE